MALSNGALVGLLDSLMNLSICDENYAIALCACVLPHWIL